MDSPSTLPISLVLDQKHGASVSRIPVVSSFRPVVAGTFVGIRDLSDPLDVLNAVFYWNDETQRRTVFQRQRLSVHLVAQKCLRVQRALNINPDVVLAVRSLETDVANQVVGPAHHVGIATTLGQRRILRNQVSQASPGPPDYHAPAFNTLQLSHHF